MFIIKKGYQLGVYVPLRALFLVAYGKTKAHSADLSSCAVTAQLISTFVFPTLKNPSSS